jgi:DnaJ domain
LDFEFWILDLPKSAISLRLSNRIISIKYVQLGQIQNPKFQNPKLQLKDYYTILQLPPSASPDEVKKAYRRLAHQYHPDKKGDDPYAAAQFTEIKEAYEILTNRVKKDHYLQQRWYAQSIGKRFTQTVIIPESILKRALELDKYSSTLDVHRMDKDGLYHYICDIVSDENIRKLNAFKENAINKEIILSLLKSGRLLPYSLMKDLVERLKKIDPPDESTGKKMHVFIREGRHTDYWERKRVWVVLVIVLLLCFSIFLAAKG